MKIYCSALRRAARRESVKGGVVSYNRGVYTYRDGTSSDCCGNPVVPHGSRKNYRKLIAQLRSEQV